MGQGRGARASCGMVQSMALHQGGCMGAPQPKGCMAGQLLPGAAEMAQAGARSARRLLAAMLSSSCAEIPAPLQPALHLSLPPLFQKTLLFASGRSWILCRFGSVRKRNFDHLCSVCAILGLAQLLTLPLLLASCCK